MFYLGITIIWRWEKNAHYTLLCGCCWNHLQFLALVSRSMKCRGKIDISLPQHRHFEHSSLKRHINVIFPHQRYKKRKAALPYTNIRGKSLLDLWVTTFLPNEHSPLIFVRFISNFLCMCSNSMASDHVLAFCSHQNASNALFEGFRGK